VSQTSLAAGLNWLNCVPSFPDAQLYINLHGYDSHQRLSPPEALDRFLRALGVANEALPADVEEQAALYRDRLSGKRALVVLDNAFCAAQVRPLLPGNPTCLVLITSRDTLGGLVAQDGARLLNLDVLSPDEAIELLVRIAGDTRVEREPGAAAELVRLCGYLPLAVGIAGARLASRLTLSVATLAERLADERHRLGELVAGDAAVRASFAFSYQELPSEAARMFRLLGLIAGPDFGPEVAATLTETNPEEAENLLEALVDAHLLEIAPGPRRYRFHDLLRLYARERIRTDETDPDRDAALQRTLTWYLESVRAADDVLSLPWRDQLRERVGEQPHLVFATRAEALAWLEAERTNLVATTHQAADCGLHAIAWQLPHALFSFFELRKHWADWQDTYKVGLAAARKTYDRGAEAWMLTGLAAAYWDIRRLEEAVDDFQQALAIHREVKDPCGEAWALYGLGFVYYRLRRLDGAIEHHRQALAIFREIGYRWGEAWALYGLGFVYYRLRRFEEAIDDFQKALAIYREVRDRWGEGLTLNRRGRAYKGLGHFEDAINDFKEALAIHREVRDRWGEAWALYGLGSVYYKLGYLDEAVENHRQALGIFRDIGDRWGEEVTLSNLAEIKPDGSTGP
jgi:tetratricopeptide (TPR) repeat protein